MVFALPFNYVDLGVLAIAVIVGLIGFKNGFIKQVGKIVTIVATIVLCVMFFKILANFLMNLSFIDSWTQKVLEWFNSKGTIFSTNIKEAGEAGVREALATVKLPEFIVNTILSKVDFNALPDYTIAEFAAPRIIQYGCYAISFLALFIVSLIVVSILVKLLSGVIKLIPFGGLANRLLGLALSELKLLLIIWAVFYAVSFLSVVPTVGTFINNFIDNRILTEDSIIVRFIYDHNLLVSLINALISGNFSFESFKHEIETDIKDLA